MTNFVRSEEARMEVALTFTGGGDEMEEHEMEGAVRQFVDWKKFGIAALLSEDLHLIPDLGWGGSGAKAVDAPNVRRYVVAKAKSDAEKAEEEARERGRIRHERMLARGPGRDQWLACFDELFDFMETSERLDPNNTCHFLVHSQRGSLRSAVLATAVVLRKYNLTAQEALAHMASACDNRRTAMVPERDIPTAAREALVVYSERHSLGMYFCDECFDEYRFGAEDGAMVNVVDQAALRLRRGDPLLRSLDLRGEIMTATNEIQIERARRQLRKYLTCCPLHNSPLSLFCSLLQSVLSQ